MARRTPEVVSRAMAAVASYSYLGSSSLAPDGGHLTLQTSGGPTTHPRFFTGFVTAAEAAAVGLLAVAEVARTRYHQPINPASLDPVVTGGRDRLRFESFSGCCGVYARLDVLSAGLDGDIVAHGTTNVDVNPPLRQALAGWLARTRCTSRSARTTLPSPPSTGRSSSARCRCRHAGCAASPKPR